MNTRRHIQHLQYTLSNPPPPLHTFTLGVAFPPSKTLRRTPKGTTTVAVHSASTAVLSTSTQAPPPPSQPDGSSTARRRHNEAFPFVLNAQADVGTPPVTTT